MESSEGLKGGQVQVHAKGPEIPAQLPGGSGAPGDSGGGGGLLREGRRDEGPRTCKVSARPWQWRDSARIDILRVP